MRCMFCNMPASAKIGTSTGNIFKALLGKKCWEKDEYYFCKDHYEEIRRKEVLLVDLKNGIINIRRGKK